MFVLAAATATSLAATAQLWQTGLLVLA